MILIFNDLHVYRVIVRSIDIDFFILMGCYYLDMGPIYKANDFWDVVLCEKFVLIVADSVWSSRKFNEIVLDRSQLIDKLRYYPTHGWL